VRPGFLSGGHFDIVSYNANFTATNGNLSSQFGIHYLNLRPGKDESVLQGLGATAVAVFSTPFDDRYDSGVPKGAVALYLGTAPTALINGRESFISIPFVLGVGIPWSPAESVGITPWIEASPGVNLDTRIKSTSLNLINSQGSSLSGTQVNLSNADIRNILSQAVDFKVSGTVGARAGLDISIRASDAVDLDLSAMLGSLGGAFHGTFVGWVGAGLVFRWDHVVPTVLPASRRLLNEDCAAVEERYHACQATAPSPVPNYAPRSTAPTTYPAYPAYSAPRPSPAPFVAPPPAAAPIAPSRPAPPPAPPPPPPAPTSTIPTTSFPP
jgi:hypothetical protein